MAEFLTTASVLQCPHGGSVSSVTSNARTKADGAYIVRKGDTFTIAGCAFNVSGSPHPCVKVQWVTSALRVKVAADDALTKDSVGLCLAADQAPQGTVLVSNTQTRSKGT